MSSAHTILYFGCLRDSGHYLWTKVGGSAVREITYAVKTATPWGFDIDGRVFNADLRGGFAAGRVRHAQKDGWSLIHWPDYSVDSRPGSHSTFVVKSLMTKDELIAAARLTWPEVFARKRFPVLS